ncbi:hypothetical protein B0H67DRAFT_639583 [Lasiosphaeris hirsuta]|uniref:RBR-type E3 ubiquitin transferase n=1 Tax=Lasiosphaeris hirsuta TaxID=260670 RepID=A0AA40BBE2_9PEZI|nr:hypothetical protein B0H67DRAFT_639583 [Lasiosphaeris hirsuta]
MCAVAALRPPPPPTIIRTPPVPTSKDPLQDNEQQEEVLFGEEDDGKDGLDLSEYDPPAILTSLVGIKSEIEFETVVETLTVILQSSLENVVEQVKAEKQHAEEVVTAAAAAAAAAAQAEAEAEAEAAEAEAAAARETADEARDASAVSNKGKSKATETYHDTTLPRGGLGEEVSEEHDRSQKRSRFGFRRLFRHSSDTNGESSALGATRSFMNIAGAPSLSAAPGQSSWREPGELHIPMFTQYIFKQFKSTIESSNSVETTECVSCFEDITPKEAIKTACHSYCIECFQRLITTALETEAQWPPKCCLNTIPFRTISKHASTELLQRYRDKDKEFKVPISDRIYCSTADCGEWIRKPDKALRIARCSQGHVMCIMCRKDPHPPGTACTHDTDRQLVDKLAEEEGWRRCIKCSVLVEHREACQHMTCRCGAQFCYVCGLVWRTCVCTTAQLATIKQQAMVRRAEREAKRTVEEAWLRDALRQIDEAEQEQRRKDEAAHAAEVAKRQEHRRLRAIERARREEIRLAELEIRYENLKNSLAKVDVLQAAHIRKEHRREDKELAALAAEERDALARKHDTGRSELRSSTAAKIEARELELERDYRIRVAWEKRLEDEYAAVLVAFWADKTGGHPRYEHGIREYMIQNDRRMDIWRRRKDEELGKFRYEAEEELAVREEVMEAMRVRQNEELAEREAELTRKHRVEEKWCVLVAAERLRLLEELEAIDRESAEESDDDDDSHMGGLSDAGDDSQSGSSADD